MKNTTSAHGYVTAYTAAGGTALHVVARYGTGFNDFQSTALCGTAPRTKWGTGTAGISWIQNGDTTSATPAEAVIYATRPVCLRCRAAAAKTAIAAEAAAPAEVEPVTAEAAPAEDAADTRATALAEASAPAARRVSLDTEAAARTAATRRGAVARVQAYYAGAAGRESCIDSVLVTVTGGDSHYARTEAATRALEKLATSHTRHAITAGEYQTIARGSRDTIFVFGTWTD